jgi:hypothetical protein
MASPNELDQGLPICQKKRFASAEMTPVHSYRALQSIDAGAPRA